MPNETIDGPSPLDNFCIKYLDYQIDMWTSQFVNLIKAKMP